MLVTAVALISPMSLAACGDKSEKSADGAPSDSKAEGKKAEIAFVQQNTGNPYFDNITKGFKDACAKLGCEVTATGPSSADPAAQVPIIQDQIQKRVSAIAIQASDPKAVLPALKRARARGIEIIAINSDQLPEVRKAAVTPVDFSKVSAEQMELLGKLMAYEGEFAVLSATTTAPFQKAVVDGMKKILKEDPKYKKMRLVKVAYGNDEPQKSTTETQGLLTSNRKIKAIIAPTTVALAAAAQAISSSEKKGDIILTGLGQPNDMRKFVKNGTVERFQLWAPYDQGFVGGYLLQGIIDGKIQAAPGVSFEVPKYGKQMINEDGVIFVAPELTTFDASNIDDYDF